MSETTTDTGDGTGTVWFLYRTGTGVVRWHAWRRGVKTSACKHLTVGALRGEVIARSDSPPNDDPRPVCVTCRKRLGLSARRGPPVQDRRPHTGRHDCACATCREIRTRTARTVLDGVDEQVQRIACGCVRQAVAAGAQDGQLMMILDEAERRMRLRSLLWEMTGDAGVRRDAGEARSLFLDCWRALVRTYAGAHDCGTVPK